MGAGESASGGCEPRRYEIRVRGLIGPTIVQAFPTLTATRCGHDTLLLGSICDLGASLLAAIGLCLGFVTSTIAAVTGVEDREQGLASGLINTSQQLGGALGLAVLAAIATSRTHHVLAIVTSTVTTPSMKGSASP